jgi:indolepyruvate decarboxylase
MTGVEISTAVRVGLNPVILVLNNDGYGTMRKIRDGCFNEITQWNYAKICELVRGGEPATASTQGELDTAISRSRSSRKLTIIDVKIARDDISPQLATISREVAKMRGLNDGAHRKSGPNVRVSSRRMRSRTAIQLKKLQVTAP